MTIGETHGGGVEKPSACIVSQRFLERKCKWVVEWATDYNLPQFTTILTKAKKQTKNPVNVDSQGLSGEAGI